MELITWRKRNPELNNAVDVGPFFGLQILGIPVPAADPLKNGFLNKNDLFPTFPLSFFKGNLFLYLGCLIE